MKLTAMAAHYFVRAKVSRTYLRNNLLNRKTRIRPAILFRAFEQLQTPNCNSIDILDPILLLCDKDEKLCVKHCIYRSTFLRRSRPTVHLSVYPTLTIGDLKSILKPIRWIPKENLVLLQHKEKPLDEDSLTLEECGVKDKDSLLACIDGNFEVTVHDLYEVKDYVIPVSSCFETLGELKKKIHEMRDLVPERQILEYQSSIIKQDDDTRLVALGIVKPYSSDMLKKDVSSVKCALNELNRITLIRRRVYG